MNLQQANQILDRHREGSHAYSLLTISKALFLTGDLREEPTTLNLDGKETRIQEPCLVQS